MTSKTYVAYRPLATQPDAQTRRTHYNETSNLWSRRYIRLIMIVLTLVIFCIVIPRVSISANNSMAEGGSRLEAQHVKILTMKREFLTNDEEASIVDPKTTNKHIAFSNNNNDNIMNVRQNLEESSEESDDLEYTPNYTIRANSSSYDGIAWWNVNTRLKYHTVSHYVRATKSFNYNSSITLTTQASLDYLHHALELSQRWDGPISIAVYAPGDDLLAVMTTIKYMRHCLPNVVDRQRIKQRITWHLVYDEQHGPSLSSLNYPSHYLNKTRLSSAYGCAEPASQQQSKMTLSSLQSSEKIASELNTRYRERKNLPYPINVLRNIARASARTRYVLASDIELYPSINITSSFKSLIDRGEPRLRDPKYTRRVFVLPIFEVKKEVQAPRTKPELVRLMNNGDAVFFHRYVCDECQNFPRRLEWLKAGTQKGGDNTTEYQLSIFEVTQRNRSRNSWEPLYIGTNDEPFYDDRLNWDGRRDKMSQMYEMCLMDYYLMILDNAFLVHAPGIKYINQVDTMKRLHHIKQNNAIHESIVSNLRSLYANATSASSC